MKIESVIKVFNEERDAFIRFAQKVTDSRMFSYADVEVIIDDVLMSTTRAQQIKVGFNDDEHIKKYLWVAVKKAIRISFFKRRNVMLKEIEPLSIQKRLQEFQLAKDIIDSHRRA